VTAGRSSLSNKQYLPQPVPREEKSERHRLSQPGPGTLPGHAV
jgi:hypothetical protein